jgi:cytochrome c biogenesis protein
LLGPIPLVILVPLIFLAAALFFQKFRNWLTSMRTAIRLLVAMAAVSMIGVLVGQQLPPEAYTERYGDVLGLFVFRSGLANVFRTWYFVLLGALIVVSTVTCTLRRIVRLVKRPGRRISATGSLLTHLSIALIAAAGLVTALTGFRYPAPRYLEAGDVIEVPEGGFSIRVDAARTEFTEEGSLSEYLTDVTVFEDGTEVLKQRIEVNHPLNHRGIGVYQYEMLPSSRSIQHAFIGVVVPVSETAPLRRDITAVPGEIVQIEGTDLSLKVLEFLADFTYDIETGTAGLASIRHDNPAVLVQLLEAGELVAERWFFMGHAGHRDDSDLPCRIFFLDYIPDFDDGLTRFEFAKQPGTPLLFAGLGLLSLGLCLTLWTRRPPGVA